MSYPKRYKGLIRGAHGTAGAAYHHPQYPEAGALAIKKIGSYYAAQENNVDVGSARGCSTCEEALDDLLLHLAKKYGPRPPFVMLPNFWYVNTGRQVDEDTADDVHWLQYRIQQGQAADVEFREYLRDNQISIFVDNFLVANRLGVNNWNDVDWSHLQMMVVDYINSRRGGPRNPIIDGFTWVEDISSAGLLVTTRLRYNNDPTVDIEIIPFVRRPDDDHVPREEDVGEPLYIAKVNGKIWLFNKKHPVRNTWVGLQQVLLSSLTKGYFNQDDKYDGRHKKSSADTEPIVIDGFTLHGRHGDTFVLSYDRDPSVEIRLWHHNNLRQMSNCYTATINGKQWMSTDFPDLPMRHYWSNIQYLLKSFLDEGKHITKGYHTPEKPVKEEKNANLQAAQSSPDEQSEDRKGINIAEMVMFEDGDLNTIEGFTGLYTEQSEIGGPSIPIYHLQYDRDPSVKITIMYRRKFEKEQGVFTVKINDIDWRTKNEHEGIIIRNPSWQQIQKNLKRFLDKDAHIEGGYHLDKPDEETVRNDSFGESRTRYYLVNHETGKVDLVCPKGHGAMKEWEGTSRCWSCGYTTPYAVSQHSAYYINGKQVSRTTYHGSKDPGTHQRFYNGELMETYEYDKNGCIASYIEHTSTSDTSNERNNMSDTTTPNINEAEISQKAAEKALKKARKKATQKQQFKQAMKMSFWTAPSFLVSKIAWPITRPILSFAWGNIKMVLFGLLCYSIAYYFGSTAPSPKSIVMAPIEVGTSVASVVGDTASSTTSAIGDAYNASKAFITDNFNDPSTAPKFDPNDPEAIIAYGENLKAEQKEKELLKQAEEAQARVTAEEVKRTEEQIKATEEARKKLWNDYEAMKKATDDLENRWYKAHRGESNENQDALWQLYLKYNHRMVRLREEKEARERKQAGAPWTADQYEEQLLNEYQKAFQEKGNTHIVPSIASAQD